MDGMTKEKIKAVLSLVAGAVFLIVFVMIAAGAVRGGVMNAFWIPAALAAMLLLHHLLNRWKPSGSVTVILICVLFLEMVLVHWYVGRELKITYAGDETAQMLAFGRYLASFGAEGTYNRDYFVSHPYLYGGSFVLSLYCRAAKLITGSFTEDGLWILNQLFIDSAIALAVVYGQKLGEELHIPALGLRLQLLCLISPCYSLFQNLVCTQTMGMPLLIGGMLLTDSVLKGKKSVAFSALLGVYWGLTCFITPLGWFFGAAWLLTAFLRLDFHDFLRRGGGAALAAIVVAALLSLFLLVSGLRTVEDIQQWQRPGTYWVMVGLESSGETDGDIRRMDAAQTLADRRESANRTAAARAKKLGLAGIVGNSFHKVTANGWQTGLFGNLENVNGTAYSRVHESILDEIVNKGGLYNLSFVRYTNVLWIAVLFFAAAAYPVAQLRRRFRHCCGLSALSIGVFGVLLMGMVGQSKSRYVLEITPAVMLLGAYAGSILSKLPDYLRKNRGVTLSQRSFFTELEEDVRQAVLREDYGDAQSRLRLYCQMAQWSDLLTDTTGFLQFETKRKAMEQKVAELNTRNHLIEKNRTFQEIWSNVNSCTARELTTAKANGEKLLQELTQYNDANDYTLDGVQQKLQKKLIEIQNRLTVLLPPQK